MSDGFASTLKNSTAACHLVCATWSVASVTVGSIIKTGVGVTAALRALGTAGKVEYKSAAVDRLGVTMWKYTAILLPAFTANKYTTVCLCCSLRFCNLAERWYHRGDAQLLFEIEAALAAWWLGQDRCATTQSKHPQSQLNSPPWQEHFVLICRNNVCFSIQIVCSD